MTEKCLTCQFNRDPSKAPGGWVKEYYFWILEHINEPIPVKGWLVLKTKRHTEGIAGLNQEESEELGKILNVLPKVQKEVCAATQIYICCFTELVAHLHIHLIPRYDEETRRGPKLFDLIDEVRKDETKAVSIREAVKIVEELRSRL